MPLGAVRGCSAALIAPLLLVLLALLLATFFASPLQDLLAGNGRSGGAANLATGTAVAGGTATAIIVVAVGLVWIARRQFSDRPLLPPAQEVIDGRPFVAAGLPPPQLEWVHIEERDEITKAIHDQIVEDQHRAAMMREAQAQTAAIRAAAEQQRRAANAQISAANAAQAASLRRQPESKQRFQVRGIGDVLPSHYIEEI